MKTWQARFERRLNIALMLLDRAGSMEPSPLMARLIPAWNEWHSARQQDPTAPFPWQNVSLARNPAPNARIQEDFVPMKMDGYPAWWKDLGKWFNKWQPLHAAEYVHLGAADPGLPAEARALMWEQMKSLGELIHNDSA